MIPFNPRTPQVTGTGDRADEFGLMLQNLAAGIVARDVMTFLGWL
jgi:hypothetical protein